MVISITFTSLRILFFPSVALGCKLESYLQTELGVGMDRNSFRLPLVLPLHYDLYFIHKMSSVGLQIYEIYEPQICSQGNVQCRGLKTWHTSCKLDLDQDSVYYLVFMCPHYHWKDHSGDSSSSVSVDISPVSVSFLSI